MRLIDADALLEVIYHEAFEKDTDMQMFENAIKRAPTIDPIRHGEWKETDDPMFKACSVCGYLEWKGLWNNYCPECGSRMDARMDEGTKATTRGGRKNDERGV